jgi:hypothetical protein
LDGYPAMTEDRAVLAFWYQAATTVIGAESDVRAYLDTLSPKERESRIKRQRVRAQIQAQQAQLSALESA